MRNKKGQFVDGNNPASIAHRFTRETSLGNQHAKGNPPNATSFTTENTMEKSVSWKGGIYKTKDSNWITYASKKRMTLGRWKWIQVYGEIPKGHVIIHIDRDKYNDELGNLDCISRAENLKRNSHRY